MRKITLFIAAIMLLAAGCNNVSQENTNQSESVQTENNGPTGIVMADVQAANTEKKCWAVIEGSVYDLTAWAAKHPGGKQNILKLCGTDGTAFFNGKHGGQPQPEAALEQYKIGTLQQ